jgi:DNA repair exonuclease SbcCD ATPase subunit
MNENEREKLIDELRAISTEFARLSTRDEERAKFLDQRFKAIDARLGKLEAGADASGRYDLAVVTKQLEKRDAEFVRWKFWALGIIGALVTSSIVGLVVHYFSTKG